MATVLQRGKRGFWYAVFRDLNGKQLWRRLKVSDRRGRSSGANRPEAKERSAYSQGLRGSYRDFYGEGMPETTVRANGEVWLGQKKPETADSSHQAYDDFKKTVGIAGQGAATEKNLRSNDGPRSLFLKSVAGKKTQL